ncbi:sugar transporter family protein [Aspergillus californicus]
MCWGSISFGYASAIIATTLGQPSFYEYMGLLDNPHEASIIGAMNSLFYVGGFFGTIFNAWFADYTGRRGTIIVACLVLIISGALVAGSVGVKMFIVFHFFTGWSCLMLLATVPLWIIEVTPPAHRGTFANIHGMMATLGYVVASYVGVGFYYYQNGSGRQWRAPLAFVCLPPLITLLLIVVIRLPESPRWLLKQGKEQEALLVVQRLRRENQHDTSSDIELEFLEMKAQVEMDRSLDASWRILLERPSYRKRALIACSLLSFIYSSGTLTVSNYGPTLFSSLGYSPAQTLLFQGGIVLTGVFAANISFFVVDRMPRNVLLASGMIAVSIPLACEAAMTAKYVGTSNQSGLGAGVAFLYVYIFAYGIFLEGPGYYYANEVFPTHLRSKGATLCIGSYALINIMWTQVSPVAFENIGWKYYLVFICCCIASAVVMFLFYPNTLNKSLEEVALMFGDDDLVAHYVREQVWEREGKNA